jgi:hypothetical protein
VSMASAPEKPSPGARFVHNERAAHLTAREHCEAPPVAVEHLVERGRRPVIGSGEVGRDRDRGAVGFG